MQDISRATGLSVGFLSQIEHNQSTPSLSSLRKVAEALDSSLFTLLAGENGGARVVRRGERKRLTPAGSEVTHELLSPTRQGSRMELSCTVLEAGARTREAPLPHTEGEEFTLVLDGTVMIEVGSESFCLERGDSIYFNSCIPHRYLNEGVQPATLLTAVSPPQL